MIIENKPVNNPNILRYVYVYAFWCQ